MTRTYKVDITNLKISKRRGDTTGNYSFNYRVLVDGKVTAEGKLDSTFTVMFTKMKQNFLRHGYGFRLVMEHCL